MNRGNIVDTAELIGDNILKTIFIKILTIYTRCLKSIYIGYRLYRYGLIRDSLAY